MRDLKFAWKGAKEQINWQFACLFHFILAVGCLFLLKIDQMEARAVEVRRYRRPF